MRQMKKWLFVLLSSSILLSACGQNSVGNTTLHITEAAKGYETMPYEEFKKQTGNEAEFYHGSLFLGESADASFSVVYEGTYDEEAAAAVLEDDDLPVRLHGTCRSVVRRWR